MKLKKIIAMLLAVAMVFALAACGSDSNSNNSGNSSSTSSKDDSQKDSKVYKLKLDCVDPSTSITAVGLERFKAEVEEKSEGRIEITIFYGSTLGALAVPVSGPVRPASILSRL